jgi:putative ABC transport system substrate-binding protein
MWGNENKKSALWYVTLIVLLVSGGLLTGGAGAAEQARPIRIGALSPAWGPTEADVSLKDNVLDLGYRENEDFVIGIRFTQGDVTALPAAARELVQNGVDLIFATLTNAAEAAQRATNQIPIVFFVVRDPLELGLIQSLAQPGGNITGVISMGLELSSKRLEVFKELIPGLKRVLFLHAATDTYAAAVGKAYRETAHRLGIELIEQAVQTEAEVQTVLAQVRSGAVEGIVSSECCSLNIPGFILEAATQRGIPTIFDAGFWVERGGLASYGPDYYEAGRQAARLVDKILKGTKPAEIPVEVNPKVEFVINLKVAEALGLTIAPEVLYQANQFVQ